MAWIDGLDIPFQYDVEAQFFDFGRDEITERATHARPFPRRAALGASGADAGLPVPPSARSPLLRYRWETPTPR